MPCSPLSRSGTESVTSIAVNSEFRAPWWLRNAHAQTLWPRLMRRPPAPQLRMDALKLADGDVLHLAWGPYGGGGVVVLLHGLGGCATSGYILGLLQQLHEADMQGVVMQFRGAGGIPNRLPRFFHAGAWEDLEQTLRHVTACLPGRRIAVLGYSMGGIVTLNWLGSGTSTTPVDTAVTVSAPFELAACARYLNRGFARLYQWDIVRGLKRMIRVKETRTPLGIAPERLAAIRTLWDFDDQITAPLHGFSDAHDYYRRCSPASRLAAIETPTLMLHAVDDPFVPAESLPRASALPGAVRMELSSTGGHVGFVTGSPLKPVYWLEHRIMKHLREAFGA